MDNCEVSEGGDGGEAQELSVDTGIDEDRDNWSAIEVFAEVDEGGISEACRLGIWLWTAPWEGGQGAHLALCL